MGIYRSFDALSIHPKILVGKFGNSEREMKLNLQSGARSGRHNNDNRFHRPCHHHHQYHNIYCHHYHNRYRHRHYHNPYRCHRHHHHHHHHHHQVKTATDASLTQLMMLPSSLNITVFHALLVILFAVANFIEQRAV